MLLEEIKPIRFPMQVSYKICQVCVCHSETGFIHGLNAFIWENEALVKSGLSWHVAQQFPLPTILVSGVSRDDLALELLQKAASKSA